MIYVKCLLCVMFTVTPKDAVNKFNRTLASKHGRDIIMQYTLEAEKVQKQYSETRGGPGDDDDEISGDTLVAWIKIYGPNETPPNAKDVLKLGRSRLEKEFNDVITVMWYHANVFDDEYRSDFLVKNERHGFYNPRKYGPESTQWVVTGRDVDFWNCDEIWNEPRWIKNPLWQSDLKNSCFTRCVITEYPGFFPRSWKGLAVFVAGVEVLGSDITSIIRSALCSDEFVNRSVEIGSDLKMVYHGPQMRWGGKSFGYDDYNGYPALVLQLKTWFKCHACISDEAMGNVAVMTVGEVWRSGAFSPPTFNVIRSHELALGKRDTRFPCLIIALATHHDKSRDGYRLGFIFGGQKMYRVACMKYLLFVYCVIR